MMGKEGKEREMEEGTGQFRQGGRKEPAHLVPSSFQRLDPGEKKGKTLNTCHAETGTEQPSLAQGIPHVKERKEYLCFEPLLETKLWFRKAWREECIFSGRGELYVYD